ncbi:probable polyol transporter 6 [Neltuma alba]|uniref:probable polyol transporter 6 n=1 Tax=Neltuma alba TaxID=207710 RepID=UPI0010A2D758|nr:probable polyol transporter 6 [Prosopis alba]
MSGAKETNGHFPEPTKNVIDVNDHESLKRLNMYACTSVIVATVISIIHGYVTSVMSGALLFIKEELKINDQQVQLLAGILNAFALPGSMVAGRISDVIGRRYTIMAASLIFMSGSILMGYGPSYPILMIGRCTSGIGAGFALVIAPVYCSEISPPSSRGFLTSFPSLFINVGILLGYVSNYFFGKMSLLLGWRMMLGVAALPSLALALIMLTMVESPRWLVMQGRVGEARRVLLLVSNSHHEAEKRLRDIKIAVGIDENSNQDVVTVPKKTMSGGGALKELFCKPSPSVRRILMAGIALHAFQRLCGNDAMLLYSPRVFGKAGISSTSKLLLATLGIGIIKVICTFISGTLLDRAGRRVMLLISAGGMVVSLVGLSVCLTIVGHSKDKLLWPVSLVIVSVYAFVGFAALGMGPATWVYSSEIFPLRLRAQGIGICVLVNRIAGVTVIMSFITIYKNITMSGTFFMFTGITVLAWLFYYFFLPETKGRSLEDMEIIFGGRCTPEVQMDKAESNTTDP